jgi:cell filamentation protein
VSPIPNDPYCYPGTDVLINHGGYRAQAELNKFESDAVFLASAALKARPIRGSFDTKRLQETHRRIFGNVYPWAGELRSGIGMMTKTRASGFVVAYGPSENVPGALQAAFTALKDEKFLRGLETAALASRLAHYYGELDAIHAFREGNSRTLRAFFADLAQAAGHRLEWARMGATEEDRQRLYQARDLAVMRGDSAQLTGLIAACLRRAPGA